MPKSTAIVLPADQEVISVLIAPYHIARALHPDDWEQLCAAEEKHTSALQEAIRSGQITVQPQVQRQPGASPHISVEEFSKYAETLGICVKLTGTQLQAYFDQAAIDQKERAAKGRYTLAEAADMATQLSPRPLKERIALASKMEKDIKRGKLPVYSPAHLSAKQSSLFLEVNPSDEILWCDLNTWLVENEKGNSFRFPKPKESKNEIVLPAGQERVTVRDIPKLFATALHPKLSETAPRQIIELKKMPLTEANKRQWCGSDDLNIPFPVRLTENDLAKLQNSCWAHLPALKLPIDETAWQPYEISFASAGITDWQLKTTTECRGLKQRVLWDKAFRAHEEGTRNAVQQGKLTPRCPDTCLPIPEAAGERLQDAFVTVENLKEYAAQHTICVRVETATTSEAPENGSPDNEGTVEIRKRGALITELSHVWPSIERDLSDANRNGLQERAKHKEHGYWKVKPALAWAIERGKITKDKASNFIASHGGSELAVMLQQLMESN